MVKRLAVNFFLTQVDIIFFFFARIGQPSKKYKPFDHKTYVHNRTFRDFLTQEKNA